jgi:hypothetical protein
MIMKPADRRLRVRSGMRTQNCFNRHDVDPARLRVVEICTATIIVCSPACETEACVRILLRIHGSLAAAFRRALQDWQAGTIQAAVVLALLDRGVARATARDSLLNLARKAIRTARDRYDTALENALASRIRALSRSQPPPISSGLR